MEQMVQDEHSGADEVTNESRSPGEATRSDSRRQPAAGRARSKSGKKGLHNVHTLGFGPGFTGSGLGRISDVFGGVADMQGLESGSSPTSRAPKQPRHGYSCSAPTGIKATVVWGGSSYNELHSYINCSPGVGTEFLSPTSREQFTRPQAAAVAYSGVWVAGSEPWLVAV